MKAVQKFGLVLVVTATLAFNARSFGDDRIFSCFVNTGSDLTIQLVVKDNLLSILRSSPNARYAPEYHAIEQVENSSSKPNVGPLAFSCDHQNENDPYRYGFNIQVHSTESGELETVTVHQSSINARFAPLVFRVIE